VDLTATVGAQVFKEIENEIRGATAVAYGGLKGSGLEGRLTGLLDVEVEPRVSAALAMRYRGLVEELDIWGGDYDWKLVCSRGRVRARSTPS